MADIIASHEKDGWDQGRVFVAGVGGRVAIRTGGPNGSGLIIDDPETARAIAHAILDADRHPMEAKALARVEIIDLTQQAVALDGDRAAERYQAVHGRPMPEHDYRFRGNPRPGEDSGDYTCGADYTAEHVAASILRDRALKAKGL